MLRQGDQHIMQFMQMLKASLVSRRNVLASMIVIGLVASAMGLTPKVNSIIEASDGDEWTCDNAPTTPTFNHYPLTFSATAEKCSDYPAIDAALDVANPQFSKSQADLDNGLTLDVGQQGAAMMYIHNGASNSLPLEQTTARNVHIVTQTDTSVGKSHQIKVTYTADNAPTYTKSFTVYTPENAKLEVIPNTGFMYDLKGLVILDQQNLNLGNSDYALGDLDACFEYSLFLSFKFKVVGTDQGKPTVSIQKTVKNNTVGNSYSDSTGAFNGDRVNFKMVVTNTGNTALNNVVVTDAIPNGLQFDDSVVTDGGTSTFSNNTLTVNFASPLAIGQSKTIEFAAKVTANSATTICNIAKVSATGTRDAQDDACVTVKVNEKPKISIKKYVKNNSTNTSYDDSRVDARTGERVNFKVTVSNPGNTTLNNVHVTDRIPEGLQFDDSVKGDGTASFKTDTFTVDFGSISAGNSKTVEFAAKVNATGDRTICNVAKAEASQVNEVSDDACVKIYTTSKPGTPNIVISKRAYNDTQKVDATLKPAARGDYITYSLIVTNTGNATERNFVVKDDLSQVLPLADMVDVNGGTVAGNMITYRGVDINPGETVVKTFKVRIKQNLDKNLTYQLRNTYGNTIVINVPGIVVYQAPKTGAAGTSAGIFAGLLTAGFVVARKRGSILKFIFA